MKRLLVFGVVLGVLFLAAGIVFAGNELQAQERLGECAGQCTTIQDGTLLASDGNVITTGFDEWGYNYQGHLFNGMYCDSYRDAAWCQPYKDVELQMKWNDAWLSNKDCDGDGILDRHYGYDSYIGSGAWLTNHQSGEYEGEDGEVCEWNYFVKIVAVPADATVADGIWYAADGTEIGPVIWGEFAIIQQVENDACAELNGLQYLSPDGAGLGQYKEKVTFIHYADGRHEQIGGPKPVKNAKSTEDDCYRFISKDAEWKIQPDYVINPTNAEGLTNDFVAETVNKAVYEWDYPTLSGIDFEIFGAPTVDTGYPTGLIGDGVNAISFGNYDATGVIAVTSVWGYFGGPPANRQITEFDVMFDTDFDWADCTAEGVDCISEKKMDLQDIATHELGHAVGLADLYTTDCNLETMYGYGSYGDIHARDLYYGDIAGLSILYGA